MKTEKEVLEKFTKIQKIVKKGTDRENKEKIQDQEKRETFK